MDFKHKKWIWLAAIAAVTIAADQATKVIVVKELAYPQEGDFPPPCGDPGGPTVHRTKMFPLKEVDVIDGYFEFHYVENCGGAFGFLSGQKASLRRPFFWVTSLIAAVFLVYLFVRLKPDEKVLMVAFSAIMGGAVGNAIDRVVRVHVVDFVYWHIRKKAEWPTFNIADVGITVGLVLILFDSFFLAPRREKRHKAAKGKGTDKGG